MGRHLPWQAKSRPPTSISAAPQRPSQATIKPSRATIRPNNRTEPIQASSPSPSKRRRIGGGGAGAGGEPSTSPRSSPPPPPGPPSQLEPMRDGYNVDGGGGDDLWMMVEDEFEALAHSFTRHLHHAEYKRLMDKAKNEALARQRATTPFITATAAAATVEGQELIPKRARQRIQRDELSKHQQRTLGSVLQCKKARRDYDLEDGNENENENQDLWRGTSLQGLMATGCQERRSLKGLDRMPSSTRAARGFVPSASSAKGKPKAKATATQGQDGDEDDTYDEDEDEDDKARARAKATATATAKAQAPVAIRRHGTIRSSTTDRLTRGGGVDIPKEGERGGMGRSILKKSASSNGHGLGNPRHDYGGGGGGGTAMSSSRVVRHPPPLSPSSPSSPSTSIGTSTGNTKKPALFQKQKDMAKSKSPSKQDRLATVPMFLV